MRLSVQLFRVAEFAQETYDICQEELVCINLQWPIAVRCGISLPPFQSPRDEAPIKTYGLNLSLSAFPTKANVGSLYGCLSCSNQKGRNGRWRDLSSDNQNLVVKPQRYYIAYHSFSTVKDYVALSIKLEEVKRQGRLGG